MGLFEGTIEASNLLSIKDEGAIEGKVVVGKLAVEAGATLNAQCLMKKSQSNRCSPSMKKKPKKPPKSNPFRCVGLRSRDTAIQLGITIYLFMSV